MPEVPDWILAAVDAKGEERGSDLANPYTTLRFMYNIMYENAQDLLVEGIGPQKAFIFPETEVIDVTPVDIQERNSHG